MAVLATALLVGMLATPLAVHAQDPPFPTPLPMCYVQPSPDSDTWPKAVTDSLGTTPGVRGDFRRRHAARQRHRRVAGGTERRSGELGGGTIAGTDPYTFTPAAGFAGADLFPYEIRDRGDQTTVGIVRISVSADVVAPSVTISQPLGGTVAGNVTVKASASDNAGVASVTFFDGASQIGSDGAAPFEAAWNTTLVANGSHTLSAVARDAAGNAGTSAVVTVNVLNNRHGRRAQCRREDAAGRAGTDHRRRAGRAR